MGLKPRARPSDLMDIYRTLHLTAAKYTFFSSTHGTFPGQVLLQATIQVIKFKKIKIIPSIFSDHNGIKLEISHRGNLENLQTYGN